MFRKSDNLYPSYQRFYTGRSDLRQMHAFCPDCLYENPDRQLSGRLSAIAEGQRMKYCSFCHENITYLAEEIRCLDCRLQICPHCSEERSCVHCGVNLCRTCAVDCVFKNQYKFCCRPCQRNVQNSY